MDIIEQLRKMMTDRGWSEYRLAKEASLPQSTISNIFHRNTLPSIPTLKTICCAFGVSLSQFFAENERAALSDAQIEMLYEWEKLSAEQKEILRHLIRELTRKD